MSTFHLTEGAGNMPVVKVANQWADAEISFYGAQVLSFTPKGQRPVLWVSRESRYEYGKAIRGGIPVCWPWFGAHPSDKTQPAHGYARILAWPMVEALELPDGRTRLSFELSAETLATRLAMNACRALLTVTVGTELEVSLQIHNQSPEVLSYTGALHSYFAVGDIAQVAVCGLDQVRYWDSLAAKECVQQGNITFAGEVDRIYLETQAECMIVDHAWNRTIRVAKRGSNSTVVWNPWIDKAQRMSDFGDEEYRQMLCVETTNAKNDIRQVAPGAQAELTTLIRVI